MPAYIGGLDVGQVTDPAALAVLRKDGAGEDATYVLGLLHRFPLRTLYPDLVRQVGEMMTRGELKGAALAIDKTGVGAGVVDMVREKLTETPLFPIVITSGQQTTQAEDGSYGVPKKDLVGAALLLLHSGRLVFAEDLHYGKLLYKELQNFQMKITTAGNEVFGAWREGQHDDLVLAVALAAWAGQRFIGEPWEPPPGSGRDRSVIGNAPPGVFESAPRSKESRYDDPDGDEDEGSQIWNRSF